ncbi:MAG TPA: hypothetical protein VF808_09335 [Ktedonobacterales bacterium]
MTTRWAVLIALGFGLLGILGGLIGVLVTPSSYQADAFVVVYAMPPGFTNLISPDEANTVNAYYQQGALQDSVIQRIRYKYPELTAQEIRQAVKVSIVAYTPLTRVTATAASPQVAVTLANAVATAWVNDAGLVITHAYDFAYTTLIDHENQLNTQMAATRAALAPLSPKSTKAQALNSSLQTLEAAYTATDASLVALQRERYTVAGNTYVATPATEASVTRSPGYLKSIGTGGAAGLALGIIVALWFTRAALAAQSRRAYTAPPARSGPVSMPVFPPQESRLTAPPAATPQPPHQTAVSVAASEPENDIVADPPRRTAPPEWTSHDS